MVTIIPKTGCDGRYSFPGLADTLNKDQWYIKINTTICKSRTLILI